MTTVPMQKCESMKVSQRNSSEFMIQDDAMNAMHALGREQEATEFKLPDYYYRQEESGDQLRGQLEED